MDKVYFARSARKHKISRVRARYVLAHYVWVFDLEDDMTLHVGPDEQGIVLEVGTVPGRNGGTCVIHAMKLRPGFRTEYRNRLPWAR